MRVSVRTTALAAALAALGVVAAPAQAVAPSGGTITQITVSPTDETEANGKGRYGPVVSDDGRYVAFWTYSASIVTGDSNRLSDVFLHDTTTGITTLVSRNAQGKSANGGSGGVAISANGKYLAFYSTATNLAGATYPGDTVGELVYRYSIASGRIKLVSKSPKGALPTTYAVLGAISGNGRYVVYTSQAHNLVPGDHNGLRDAFRYDATTDETIKVSRTLDGQETDKYSYATAISGNGRYVAWRPRRRTWGPPTPTTTRTPTSSTSETGTNKLISHDASGIAVGGRPTAISDNGKIVSLTSASAGLAPGDTDEYEGAFVYSAATDEVTLISTARPEWPTGVSAGTTSISANGRYVAYSAVAWGDADGGDVYLYDRRTKQSTTISAAPDGSAANGGSGTPYVSRSGNHFAFCSTATNLVPGDTYGNCDIFLWSRS